MYRIYVITPIAIWFMAPESIVYRKDRHVIKYLESDKLELFIKVHAGQEKLEIIWRKKIST